MRLEPMYMPIKSAIDMNVLCTAVSGQVWHVISAEE
jgi:hypothetical protein